MTERGGDANGRGRTQFAGNVIPANRLNPVAVKLLALLPAPTDLSKTDQNYTRTDVTRIGMKQFTGRVDYAYSENTRLFGRYTYFDSNLDVPVLYGDVAGGRRPGIGDPEGERHQVSDEHGAG